MCNSNPLEATKAISDEIALHGHILVQYRQINLLVEFSFG